MHHVSKRRNRSALLALVATAFFLLPASQAGAAEFPNACAILWWPFPTSTSILVTMTAEAEPAGPVKAGDTVVLKEIKQELKAQGVFVTLYKFGLLRTGLNKIPIELKTQIRGTNTVEEAQPTNSVATEFETTITDPTYEYGDEEATSDTVSVAYDNQTWTAGASGPINFREKTVTPFPVLLPQFTWATSGINMGYIFGDLITVPSACDPGTVEEGASPSTITLETAPAFVSVANEDAANRAPTANAGADRQKVGLATYVSLNGTESSDSSEEAFALKYNWTQVSGPSVTLSGATTPSPSFTTPAKPATLTFKLEVCDNDPSPLCSSDEVVIKVGNLPPTANAGPDQEVASGVSVSLNGGGSSDPDGDPLTYEWSQTGGPSATLSGAETANARFTAPSGPASLTFELEVCDNGGPSLCATDSVVITVKAPTTGPAPEPENTAPNTKLKSVKIKKHKVTFKFSSNEAGSSFLCKLDNKASAKCKSPKTYKNLKPGRHKFQVKARDPQGKVDPSPVVKQFKIEK